MTPADWINEYNKLPHAVPLTPAELATINSLTPEQLEAGYSKWKQQLAKWRDMVTLAQAAEDLDRLQH